MPFYNQQPAQADWNMQVARSLVAQASSVNIYGYQAAVNSAFVPVWENNAAYVYPTVATTMLLYSTSASDTNISVLINGLDATYAPISETLVLTNGTTGVTTTKSYFRINSIFIASAVANVGNIILGNAGKTETYAQITDGNGRSQMMIYTVPKGYTFYLTRSNAYSNQNGNTNNAYCTYRVWTKSSAGVQQILLQAPFTSSYQTLRVVPRPYLEGTDIQWQANTPSGSAAVGIGVEGVLISNSAM